MADETSSEAETDEPVDDDADVDVEVNEDALEAENERRTVELEVPIDEVHATAADQLEAAGVDVEAVLSQRLRPTTEDAIHQTLQQAKYSE
jgi:hypothetical protein